MSFEGGTPPISRRDGWLESFVSTADGTRLYVRRRPSSSDTALTALLCDGIACDGFIWRFLVDDLRPLAQVVHWNYRGHGRSSAPGDPQRIDMAAIIDDLARVRAEQAPAPLLLVGHSMGCQVVLEAYRRDPRGIAGLVLICGAPGRMTHTFKGRDALAQALPRLIAYVDRHPQLARALWSNFPPEVAARLALAAGEVDVSTIEPDDLVRYSEHVANLDLPMFLRMLQVIGDDTAEDVLATVEVPALVIAGALDTFTPRFLAERMAATLPNGELAIVEGATHVVPIERRQLVRELFERFVNERTNRAPMNAGAAPTQ